MSNHALLTTFGFASTGVMFASYWLEPKSRWYVAVFAGACAATAIYSAMVPAYPVAVIETLWAMVAWRRFLTRSRQEAAGIRPMD